jgi:hypothetical protein
METTAGTIAVKVGGLVVTGFCLAIGFWAGKKLTNKIDEFLYTHSKEFKELCEHEKNAAGAAVGASNPLPLGL